ncbi:hypothetical protein LCGC14_0885690 [marine sediment metagenome]|uniref:Uncharacterized protein n=1 Tax=marine sediment metagenome TaxID=412755 RepID=A0A0F9PLC0_9ZZZZ
MALMFAGCPIHEGNISIGEICLFCEHYAGKKGDLFYPLKWCKHPDNLKRRDRFLKKRRELI